MSRLRTPASHPTAGVSPPFSTEPPKSGRLSSVSTKPPNSGCLSSVLRRATQQRVSRLRTTVQSSSQCIDASRPSGLRPPVCRLARTPQVGHPAFGLRFADLLRLRPVPTRLLRSGSSRHRTPSSDSPPTEWLVERRKPTAGLRPSVSRACSSSQAGPSAFGLRSPTAQTASRLASCGVARPDAGLRRDSPPAEWLVPTSSRLASYGVARRCSKPVACCTPASRPPAFGLRLPGLLTHASRRSAFGLTVTDLLIAMLIHSKQILAHPLADHSAFGLSVCRLACAPQADHSAFGLSVCRLAQGSSSA